MKKKLLITATPPTPNGDLHLGHLSGPYIAADVYRRYMTMKGHEARYISGGDDHQSFVSYRAQQLGWAPRQVAGHFGREIVATLEAVGVGIDLFAMPLSSPNHDQFVIGFFQRLYEQGKLIAKEAPALWCETCDRYLFEAYVGGLCPYCGVGSDGNVCEACARPNQCVDLIDATCKVCRTRPAVRQIKRLYFPLSAYHEQLKDYFSHVAMNSHMAALCDRMLVDGLPDIAVSHVADWGLPIPVPGFEGQTLYAWFEMAPGYLSATQEMLEKKGSAETWETFWRSENGEVVQFFGYDNGYFHAILFTAELMAYDPEIHLPSAFVVNEFYQLEGSKFSTSRGHAVWGKEALAYVPPDVVRFYLAWDRPEAEQTNFQIADFRETVDRELLAGWAPWLTRLLRKAKEETNGTVPPASMMTGEHRRFLEQLEQIRRDVTAAYEAASFSPQRVARLLSELVRVANRFGQMEAFWRTDEGPGGKRLTALALELTAAAVLGWLAAPLMPDLSSRLLRELGVPAAQAASWPEGPVQPLPAGQCLSFSDEEYFGGVEAGLRSLIESRKRVAA